jgi:hypothetical protein
MIVNLLEILCVCFLVWFTSYCYALFCLQALLHACIACSLKPSIDWIAASDLEEDSAESVLNPCYLLMAFCRFCFVSWWKSFPWLTFLYLTDTRSTCSCMGDFKGKTTISIYLFSFLHYCLSLPKASYLSLKPFWLSSSFLCQEHW